MKKLLLTGIAALFLATGAAHAVESEAYAKCAEGVVGYGTEDQGEHGKLRSFTLVRWKKMPQKVVIEYEDKTQKLKVNGKPCVWID
jgi:hypothetical protein